MSLFYLMWIVSLWHVDFKKQPCHPVESKGQGPYFYPPPPLGLWMGVGGGGVLGPNVRCQFQEMAILRNDYFKKCPCPMSLSLIFLNVTYLI